MYACMHAYTYIRIHIMHTSVFTDTYVYTYAYECACVYVCVRVRESLRQRMRVRVYDACEQPDTHECLTCMHSTRVRVQ